MHQHLWEQLAFSNLKPFSSLDDEIQTTLQVCTSCWLAQEKLVWFDLLHILLTKYVCSQESIFLKS